jgi:hypothetical protein
MTSDALFTFVLNDRPLHDSVVHHIKMLRADIDRAARQVAKANAEWHDDPEADDHAEHHAHADVQFPRVTRDEAIRDLVSHYLVEMALNEQATQE